MKVKLLALVGALALTGCATNDYALYAETQQKIAQANAMAETARYAALAEIAKQGDSAAKVAAVMSLNMGSGGTGPRVQQQVNAPISIGDRALQWTSVLLPSLTNLYGINANRQVAITQSNNQAAVAQSTNATFATMNSNMATSNTAIANSGLTAVTTTAANGLTATQNVATAGITGIVTTAANGMNGIVTTGANGLTAATTISNNANTAITSVSTAANNSIQTLSNTIPNLQPNVTTTTTTTNNNLTCPAGKTLVNGSCV